MLNQIKNLLNNAISEVAILVIVCCFVGNTLLSKFPGEGEVFGLFFILTGGTVLFLWLVWACYIFATRRVLTEMSLKAQLIIETISRIMMLLWVYLVSDYIFSVIPFALLFAWQTYRLIQDKIGSDIG